MKASPSTPRVHKAQAVAVEYDAERVVVREAEKGLLVVTNTNLAFNRAVPTQEITCGRFKALSTDLQAVYGKLDGSQRHTEAHGVLNGSTLHLFHCVPAQENFWIRHQTLPGNLAEAVKYPMPGLE